MLKFVCLKHLGPWVEFQKLNPPVLQGNAELLNVVTIWLPQINIANCHLPKKALNLVWWRPTGSVAVRGWLYSNVHPGPRRFQAMRGPQALLVQKAAAANRVEANAVYCRLTEQRCQAPGALAGPASISCSRCVCPLAGPGRDQFFDLLSMKICSESQMLALAINT